MIIGILLVFGIFAEVMWVLAEFLSASQINIPIFNWLHYNHHTIDILIVMIRVAIMGAVLITSISGEAIHTRTQDFVIVRLLRAFGLGFVAYSLLEDKGLMAGYGYIFNYTYLVLMALEVYLLAILIVKSKKRQRRIFLIEISIIILFILFGLFVQIDFNSMGVIRYTQSVYMAIVGIMYIVSYVTGICLLAQRKSKLY